MSTLDKANLASSQALKRSFILLSILKSHKGQGGGFSLRISPERIYLVKLAEIFQGPLKLNDCIFRRKACPSVKVCALSAKLKRIEKIVKKELSLITIASLVREDNVDK